MEARQDNTPYDLLPAPPYFTTRFIKDSFFGALRYRGNTPYDLLPAPPYFTTRFIKGALRYRGNTPYDLLPAPPISQPDSSTY
jgi:hypothetical protein